MVIANLLTYNRRQQTDNTENFIGNESDINVKLVISAIQNDRDRIGPTKKAKLSSGSDDDQAATPARMADQV